METVQVFISSTCVLFFSHFQNSFSATHTCAKRQSVQQVWSLEERKKKMRLMSSNLRAAHDIPNWAGANFERSRRAASCSNPVYCVDFVVVLMHSVRLHRFLADRTKSSESENISENQKRHNTTWPQPFTFAQTNRTKCDKLIATDWLRSYLGRTFKSFP